MTSKICTKCKLDKPFSEYGNDSACRFGLKPVCKPCTKQHRKQYNKEYSQKNRDRKIEISQKWYAENKERRQEYDKQYRTENKESITKYKKNWYYKTLPETRPHRRAATAKRRAVKLNAIPSWADLKAITNLYKQCSELNKQGEEKYHVDHIVPLQGRNVCGLHVEYNLRIISASENLRKSRNLQEDLL